MIVEETDRVTALLDRMEGLLVVVARWPVNITRYSITVCVFQKRPAVRI